MEKDKDIQWIGSSRKDLTAMPDAVKAEFGHGLYLAPTGERHAKAKTLTGYEGAIELIEDHDGDTYRAVYTTKIDDYVYVLHCFQKKSTNGIGLPKHDAETIKIRLKAATRASEEKRNEQKKGM